MHPPIDRSSAAALRTATTHPTRSTSRTPVRGRGAVAILVVALSLFVAGCSAADDTATGSSLTGANNESGIDPDNETTDGNGADESDDAGEASGDDQRTFFDDSTVGSIEVAFDQEDFDAMIEAYSSTGEKEWIEATVTIDGVVYRQVGMRLKGNSSLFALGIPVMAEGEGAPGVEAEGEFIEVDPECLPEGTTIEEVPLAIPESDPADTAPENLPWLIRLDKFVEDQEHQGRTRFAVRGSNDPVPLVEALALDLLERSGLASQRATMVRFGVNDGEERLRLVVEVPDDRWMEDSFGGEGFLYKADASGDYEYRGADATTYAEAWAQDGGEDDLGPLIDFLQFVNESTDEDFVDQLDQHLDVEAFARYLAFQELIVNSDDIVGPGNNSYLHIDAHGLATVVAWDHNLAFAGVTSDQVASAIGVAAFDPGAEVPELPEGCELPPLPEGPGGPDGAEGEIDPNAFGPVGPSNPLVERWKTTPALVALVDEARDDLRAELFDSGIAENELAALAATVRDEAGDLVDAEAVDGLVEEIAKLFPEG